MNDKLKALLVVLFLLNNLTFGQIKVTPLPQNQNGVFDQVFFDKNEFRNVELLNSGWNVYYESDPQKKISVSVPAIFEGEDALIFERKISLTSSQIQNQQLVLGFFGLNHTAEISVNGYNIYKHSGGAYPFEIPLPKDILKENSTITIKVNRKLDSESSVPSTQRFLFAKFDGGIFRDVYLKTVSALHITHYSVSYSLDQSLAKASFSLIVGIGNSAFKKSPQAQQSSEVLVRVNLFSNNSVNAQTKGDFVQTISAEDNLASVHIELPNPILWSPQTPNYYLCEVSLLKDGQVIDKTVKQISIFQLKKGKDDLLLNGNPFALQGTTYLLGETSLRRTSAYQKIKDDLTLIKNTGFNAVRFAKYYPNPYTIKICQELGLFALVELPLNSVPEEILSRNDFLLQTNHLIKELVSSYSEFGSNILFGVGSSFLPNSPLTETFLSNLNLNDSAKNFFYYASFIGTQTSAINNLDLYGIELYSSALDNTKDDLQKAIDVLGKNSIFISETTYPDYKGNLSGYLTKNSTDAQAKYFGDMINLSRELKVSGFFINSLFEFKGEFASLYGGYFENYKFGILDPSRNLNNIAYKVIAAKLTDDSKVTIPIGTHKEDNPIIFILIALSLSIFMAVLINTKRQFREDCTRALLRPYNFFADVRDHRILSGIHTAILTLIQAGSASLLITIILFYLRSDILFEKILLSFGSHSIMKAVSFLAWNPQFCFVIIFFICIVKFAFISVLIKFGSFFIKTRVEFGSIFFSVIWSFLPLTLLLPVELILFKILVNGSFSVVIIIFLIFYFLWILQRLLKGIYVIFDVRPLMVYIYSLIVMLVIAGGIILKFQLSSSTLYYISNAIKQYKSMIL